MADLSITAANVVPAAGYSSQGGVAAGTITAGEFVYKNAAGKWTPGDATSTTNAGIGASAFGIALNSASANQPVVVMTAGTITIGATTTQGMQYVLSTTSAGGKIAPLTDFSGYASGSVFVEIGAAPNATQIILNFSNYAGAVTHA